MNNPRIRNGNVVGPGLDMDYFSHRRLPNGNVMRFVLYVSHEDIAAGRAAVARKIRRWRQGVLVSFAEEARHATPRR